MTPSLQMMQLQILTDLFSQQSFQWRTLWKWFAKNKRIWRSQMASKSRMRSSNSQRKNLTLCLVSTVLHFKPTSSLSPTWKMRERATWKPKPSYEIRDMGRHGRRWETFSTEPGQSSTVWRTFLLLTAAQHLSLEHYGLSKSTRDKWSRFWRS